MGFTPGSGAPTISSIHTLSKTDTTVRYDTVVTYDASGNPTTKLRQAPSQVNPFDSVTTAGNPGDYYVIYGTNLGSTETITFNGLSAYFNRALMTDQTIVVQIPTNVPTSGPQATDTLTIVTLHGTVNYKFTVIAPPPTITSLSDYNFWTGLTNYAQRSRFCRSNIGGFNRQHFKYYYCESNRSTACSSI